jgi:hypothetical protein
MSDQMKKFEINKNEIGSVEKIEEVLSKVTNFSGGVKCYKFYPGEIGTTFVMEVSLTNIKTKEQVTIDFDLTELQCLVK